MTSTAEMIDDVIRRLEALKERCAADGKVVVIIQGDFLTPGERSALNLETDVVLYRHWRRYYKGLLDDFHRACTIAVREITGNPICLLPREAKPLVGPAQAGLTDDDIFFSKWPAARWGGKGGEISGA